MQIAVLIEKVPGNGYRARGTEPLGLCGEGATREEAVASLRQQCEEQFRQGAELISVEVGPQPHPWLPFAGMFKDDPLIKDWRGSVEEYRQSIDDDQQAL